MKNKIFRAVIIALAAIAVASTILYYVPGFHYSTDKIADELIGNVIIRGAVSVLLFILAADGAERRLLIPNTRSIWRNILVSLPCFAVAIINFPFSALIGGSASVERLDLLWLFALNCILISVSEEVFFRGMLQSYFGGLIKNRRFGLILTVAATSAVFSLWHFFNLISGGFGAVAFQVGYTFLIGAMLSVTLLMTDSLWICILIHALFDFGGAIVPTLGSGEFQDDFFWMATVIVGLLVGIYIVSKLIRLQKRSIDKRPD